jgi:hypothetical protein
MPGFLICEDYSILAIFVQGDLSDEIRFRYESYISTAGLRIHSLNYILLEKQYLWEQHNLQSKCAKEVKYTLQTFISCEFL